MKAHEPSRGYVEIDQDECKGCGLCIGACPPAVLREQDRLSRHGYLPAIYLGDGCTGCGICFYVCPEPGAITVYKLAPPQTSRAGDLVARTRPMPLETLGARRWASS